MKLIMENWRQFLKEEIPVIVDPTDAERAEIIKKYMQMSPKQRREVDQARMRELVKFHRAKQARDSGPQMMRAKGYSRRALVQPLPKDEQDVIDAAYADGIKTRSIINDMIVSMLDPRGPWGYAGRDPETGESLTNWRAFKKSLNAAKQAEGAGNKAIALAIAGLSLLALIPFLPSPSKAAASGTRSAVRTSAGTITKTDAISQAKKISTQVRAASKDPALSQATKKTLARKADRIEAGIGEKIKFHEPRTPGFNPAAVKQAELTAAQAAAQNGWKVFDKATKSWVKLSPEAVRFAEDVLDVLYWAPRKLTNARITGTHLGAAQGLRSAAWHAKNTPYFKQFGSKAVDAAREWIKYVIKNGEISPFQWLNKTKYDPWL